MRTASSPTPQAAYQFTFPDSIALADVESSLLLALFATESVHGEAALLLSPSHRFDRERRTLVIDAETEVGQTLGRILLGFLRREFASDQFTITPLPLGEAEQTTAGASR